MALRASVCIIPQAAGAPSHQILSQVLNPRLLLQGPQAAGELDEADVPDSDAAASSDDELASEPSSSDGDEDEDERQRCALPSLWS